ncbi:hypothetical protein LZ31DRAFT_587751 [Colletotrichum somersetense]|nr:hypothetical protein LZ31DRAFT_587751 [Colletotrichum somersetense]
MRSFIPPVALLGLFVLPAKAQNPHHVVGPVLFPGITPRTDLVLHDCYTVSECARLTVHAKVTDPRRPKKVEGNCGQPTVDLASVKLPYFPVPGGPAHQGAVHVSLGGWGSSYTDFLVRFGEDYAPLFAGYDLLAIDHRGWGWLTPAFRCFAPEDGRKQFALSEPRLLGADDAAYAAREKWAEELAKKCKKNGEDVGRFMGTYSSPASSSLAYSVTTAQPSQIKDAERGLDAFFYTCLKAPVGNCSFAGPSTTIADLRSRYNALEAKLKTNALTVKGTDKKTPPFEGILAGVCTDERRHLKGNRDEFKWYFKSITEAAPSVAAIYSEWRLVCSKWKIDPVDVLEDQDGARFSPSVLVKTLAAGHTSFTSISNRLFGVFYTFFVLGQMPAEGTTCGDLFAPPFGVQLPSGF